jgi:hypothetical protein
LAFVLLNVVGCTDEFYLSEKEARAYQSVLTTEASANLHFDNLTGRIVDLQFDNSTGTPRLLSSNLLTEMRRTEMTGLEIGSSAVSLDRLRQELERQIDAWIAGRLQLYIGNNNSRSRLTQLTSASVRFLNNPTFTYNATSQSIAFDLRVTITLNCTIEVNELDWFLDLFFDVNGTYPLQIVVNDLRLQGQASILSPFADAGRIRFQLTPERLGTIDVLETGPSVPGQVRDGVRDLLGKNLSSRVDEVFYQKYGYFALPQLRLAPAVGQTPVRLEVSYRPIPDLMFPRKPLAQPNLHLVTRALDGKLYHSRKSEGGWSTFTAVPFPSPSPTPYPTIYNDPTLVHSGGDQLELAAIDSNGSLLYAHWRDEAWGSWRIFTPGGSSPTSGYRGKPTIVATAPGQADIFAADASGNLWHLRRISGGWTVPSLVPLSAYSSLYPPPYRDPVAVHVGNKIVIVFVDGQNRPKAIAYDLETNLWGQPTSFGTQTTTSFAPAAVASGDNRVDVVYVGPGGAAFHRLLEIDAPNFLVSQNTTGIGFRGNEANLGGSFNAAPMLTASSYKQLELVARGTDNRIKHNHFVNALAPFTVDGRTVNPGWQGWSGSMTDNFFGTARATDGRVSEFSIAATRTGKTELVTRAHSGYIFTQQYLFYNSYDSTRYGRALWKTVHWRSYENIGNQQFLGRPAVVAVDRNFETAFIGNLGAGRSTPHTAHLGEINSTSILLFSVPNVRASSNVIDPITLSSGPGIIDNIVMRDDGRPEHWRGVNGGGGPVHTLTPPAGVTVTKMAAASYGNGFIELVALGNDNRLYQWRYRNQAWSGPTALANNVISAPVLQYVGAGQLELLAIEPDYKLKRWRFVGNAWTTGQIISGNFRINNVTFGQSNASSWGDGTLDVVVVNADTKELYQRRIGPGDETCTMPFGCPAPRVFNNLGGRVIDKPVLTAFSATKLNVLTMQGLRWHSSWSSAAPLQPILFPPLRDPLLNWSGFEYIGGDEMVVGSAAHSGSKNLVAVAIRDGVIYVNRYQGGRWIGFQQVVGQTPQMPLRLPIFLPAIASHGG